MLTWDDCIALCALTKDEARAIAKHKDMPLLAAVELGTYLVDGPDGAPRLSAMIVDDMKAARARGDRIEELKLKSVMRHFIEQQRPAPLPVACCCC